MYLIPDPDVDARGTSAAEGVAVGHEGNIYGAEVGPRALNYVKQWRLGAATGPTLVARRLQPSGSPDTVTLALG